MQSKSRGRGWFTLKLQEGINTACFQSAADSRLLQRTVMPPARLQEPPYFVQTTKAPETDPCCAPPRRTCLGQ